MTDDKSRMVLSLHDGDENCIFCACVRISSINGGD